MSEAESVDEQTQRLLAILEAEERVHLEMRDLLQRERELMARLDAAGLGEVSREKEALADEGRLVEESRIAVAAGLARRFGLDDERPTLSRLCEALGDAAGPLRQAHTRLVVLVSVVRELLDANVALAGDNLGRIRGTLQLLGRMLPVEPPDTGRLVRRSA
jgi:hypothetical protein